MSAGGFEGRNCLSEGRHFYFDIQPLISHSFSSNQLKGLRAVSTFNPNLPMLLSLI